MSDENTGTPSPDVGGTRAEPGTGVDAAGPGTGVATDALGNIDVEGTPGESVFSPEEKAAAAEKQAFGDQDPFKTFRGEDGALNEQEAAKAYHNLRAKLSQGKTGETPESAEGYTYDFGDVAVDEAQANAFKEQAFEAGFTQDQYELIMGKYVEEMNTLTASMAGPTADDAQTALTETWGEDFEGNMQAAAKAWQAFGTGDVDAIGNNVEVLQLLAAIGSQLGEDDFNSNRMESAQPTNVLGQDDLNALRGRKDYWTNPEVQERVRQHYAAQMGEK